MVGFCAAKIGKDASLPFNLLEGCSSAAHPIFVRGLCRKMKRGVNEWGDASTPDEPYRMFSLEHESSDRWKRTYLPSAVASNDAPVEIL